MRILPEIRVLTAKAGNTDIFNGLRIRVQGRANMTLQPDLFLVEVYNPTDEDVIYARKIGSMSVFGHDGGLVCYGEIEDVYTRQDGSNDVTVFSLSDTQTFWESKTVKSIGAGIKVSAVIRSLAVGAAMGSYLADDLKIVRGMSVSGRNADVISMLAKSVNARAFVSGGVLHVVSKGRAEILAHINEDDVLEEPQYADGVCIVKTVVKGWPVGMMCMYDRKMFRIIAQEIDADNLKGLWRTNVFLISEDALDADGMGGG